jgi:tetratricopeptide (TPR) repeat protein
MQELKVHECPHPKERLGRPNDGGYVIADLPDSYDLLLSAGIGDDNSFEAALSNRYQVVGICFDGSVDRLPIAHEHLLLRRWHVNGTDHCLSDHFGAARNVFLKMDIEGAEYECLNELCDSGRIAQVKQLVVEFHDLGGRFDELTSLIGRINATHALVHVHPNNAGGATFKNKIKLPDYMEFTFIRADGAGMKPNSDPVPNPAIDMPNVLDRPDIVLDAAPYVNGPLQIALDDAIRLEDECKYAEAVRCYKNMIQIDPGSFVLYLNCGLLLKRLGDASGARAMFEAAARIDREQAAVPLGEMLHSVVMDNLHAVDEATWATAKEAFDLCWDQETGWVAMGMAALKTNRFVDLVPSFRMAHALHGDKWPVLRKVLFLMLVESHKYGEALSIIKSAPAEEEDVDPSMCSALSILYMQFGSAADAFDLLEGCTKKYGNILQLMNFKAGALYEMGETEAALSVHESVSDECAGIDSMVSIGTNMLLMTNCVNRTGEQVTTSHLKWGQRFASMVNTAVVGPIRGFGGKMRIGYIGGDFRQHAVMSFALPLLTMFDKERFVVHIYDNGTPQESDRISQKIRDSVNLYKYVSGLGLDAAVELVLEGDLDLLIDLGGHTAGARLDVMAVKPARKTLTMIGYCNTTGLPNMDYRIVDETTDPPRNDSHCTEKLIRVPGCFLNYMPTVAHDLPDCFKDARAMPCFAYGCFSKIGKITDAMWAAWGKILQRRKGSVLVIKTKACLDEKTLDRLLNRVRGLERIDASRLHLMGHTGNTKEHMACFNALDVCLDPFPYTSTTIACESLSMGVPIVTLTGDSHRSRVCTSILRNSGFGEWASDSLEEYIDKAVKMVPPDKKEVRRKFLSSPMCDPEGYVKKIEKCYTDIFSH